jgi:hypothetical protein
MTETVKYFKELEHGTPLDSAHLKITIPRLSKYLREEEIKAVIKCNERIMGYFEEEVRRRRNTYKPKLKATLEHQNDIGKLFKNLLMETQEAA